METIVTIFAVTLLGAFTVILLATAAVIVRFAYLAITEEL